MTTLSPAEPDLAVLAALADAVLDDVKGHQAGFLAALGDHLGLFSGLAAHGPVGSVELSAALHMDERYVREWLHGMTTAGYVSVDAAGDTFSLTPEQALVFATDDSPAAMGAMFHGMPGMWNGFDALLEAFRAGGGIGLDQVHEHWWTSMERFTGGGFDRGLLDVWIPAADGIHEALQAGAHVADVGCGRGKALITLLQAYPAATAVGYDLSSSQVAVARRRASASGVADRVRFVVADAADGLGERFDLVTAFDVLHDLAAVDRTLEAVHTALRPGGSLLALDFRSAATLGERVGREATMLYGWSVAYCLTTSLAQQGDALGTCGLPEPEMIARLARAGFGAARALDVEDPFQVLYQARA
ncbi:SAM-dependent methyltransferase [Euzebya tangerina]|uniref:SAM-dependent methyltransferase n=1 Tax=Euzebya tangerina TaxID=591198 RepID=UPI0013C370BD|nr:class I SAM-dependent methyltransferase [Euzebya tangerina]